VATAQIECAPAPASARSGSYERHRPEDTVLYQTLRAHWRTFLAEVSGESGSELPRFVIEEVEAFLKCGILAHGFLRVVCDECHESRLVAFSCKRRGFCSSCLGRRMCDFAAHLRDHVMPRAPVRQWVLTVPHGLRFRMAFNPEVTGLVLRTFVSVVSRWLRRWARAVGIRGLLKTGGVTVIQRFGSALNLNVHFHTLMIDGVYELRLGGPPIFHPVPAPTDDEVAAIVRTVLRKVGEKIARLDDVAEDAAVAGEPLLASLASASVAGVVATGARRGARVGRVIGPGPGEATVVGRRCALVNGFSLHANVRIAANDRDGLEHVARYLARPPIATDRLTALPNGNVALQLKRRWSDGTEALVFTPAELIAKLLPLVPRPRKHVIRFHGVLAPAAAVRARIVPHPKAAEPSKPTAPPGTAYRLPWATLLRRVFLVDALECPRCHGRMRIVAAVMEATACERILCHLGHEPRAPTLRAARAPPAGDPAVDEPPDDFVDPPAPEDFPA
jgi:Putative transposase/Transposase zinc-binding domain